MSTETFDISEVERLPERLDEREDDEGCEDGQQQSIPLGVELTGYRLLTTSIILGLGIPKAVYSYNGQSLISTTLDWVAGVLLALILYWLGVIEANRPGLSPVFFQVDLAPPILKFIRRSEVQLWFLSVLPLLLTSTQLRDMLGANRDNKTENTYGIPAHLVKDGLILAVLAFSVAICIFCLQCLSVVWPRGFRATRHHALLFIISAVMWLAYNVYLVVKVVSRSSDFPRSIIKIAVHNTLWTFPFTLLPISKERPSGRKGYLPTPYNDLIMPAYVIFAEAVLMGVWGFPDFPESLYGVFFLGCVAAFFLGQFLATVSISRDLPITHAGAHPKPSSTESGAPDARRGLGHRTFMIESETVTV